MLLDAIVTSPDLFWLSGVEEKVAFCNLLLQKRAACRFHDSKSARLICPDHGRARRLTGDHRAGLQWGLQRVWLDVPHDVVERLVIENGQDMSRAALEGAGHRRVPNTTDQEPPGVSD